MAGDSIREQYFPVQESDERGNVAQLELNTLSPSRRNPAAAADNATATSASGSVVDMLDISLNDGDEGKPAAAGAPATSSEEKRQRRVPRRVIHCSDGVVEEYSTDEEELEELRRKEEHERKKTALIDPRTLTWLPWMLHYTWSFGSSFIGYCDFFGEKLAWFFGITSPKYYYELEEYRREQEAEEERAKKEDIEIRGWRETSSTATSATAEDPPIELDPTKLMDSPRSPGSLTAS